MLFSHPQPGPLMPGIRMLFEGNKVGQKRFGSVDAHGFTINWCVCVCVYTAPGVVMVVFWNFLEDFCFLFQQWTNHNSCLFLSFATDNWTKSTWYNGLRFTMTLSRSCSQVDARPHDGESHHHSSQLTRKHLLFICRGDIGEGDVAIHIYLLFVFYFLHILLVYISLM